MGWVANLLVAIGVCAGVAACTAEPSDDAGSSDDAFTTPNLDTFRVPASGRIVAIGNLHGDLGAARRALRLAGAIDASDHWIGGNLVVVQTGDLLDRGPDDLELIELTQNLIGEARAAGGAFVALNGNHEILNVHLDFTYTTADGLASFNDAPGLDLSTASSVPASRRARTAALRPGGPYARELATRNILAIVGDTVFVHGGILPKHVAQLTQLNANVQRWMNGQGSMPSGISANDSPVWTRNYGSAPTSSQCRDLTTTLSRLGVTRMVVGHTVQDTGINAACGDKVWRIDVGLSAAYDNEHVQHGEPRGFTEVLEIENGQVRVLGEQ